MIRPYAQLLTVIAVALASTSAIAGPKRYQLHLLPESYRATGASINESGQIAGAGDFDVESFAQPFFYDPATGVIHNPGEPSGRTGVATSINEAGTVTGYFLETSGPEVRFRSFIYDGNELTYFDASTVGSRRAIAQAINDAGQVAGALLGNGADASDRGFIWDGDDVQTFEIEGATYVSVADIDNSGAVLGASFDPSVRRETPFIYRNGEVLPLLDSTFTEGNAHPYDINEHGVAVGYFWDGVNEYEAASFADGKIKLLGTLGEPPFPLQSTAAAINNHGVIVGDTFVQNSLQHGFIYIDDVMYDLNDYVDNLGDVTIMNAGDINDQGQITGSADSPTLGRRAYILTPIPEPTTFALAAITALLAALAAKAARRAGG